MLVAFITKSSEYVLYVIVAYSLIQFVDNNYIVPKIVASKVKINALFSIIVVIAAGARYSSSAAPCRSSSPW
jgi:predicted PurR-regulated permease PerM